MMIDLATFDGIDFPASVFIRKVEDEFKRICADSDYGKLTRARGSHQELKKFIEEILPLQKYLLFILRNGLECMTIKWKNSNQKGIKNEDSDAILNATELIEITVAEHEKEYIIREHMNKGNPSFGADGASKKNGITNCEPMCKSPEDRINSHTKMLETAINKKLKKHNNLSALVIYLNQDGLLMEDEFNTVIENIEGAFSSVDKIAHIYIWSFQYEALIACKRKVDMLNSTPESDPIPQSEKGGNIMKCRCFPFSPLLYRASRAMGSTLARIYRLCCGIKFSGFGVSLIPGLITCNISFRAGGSGSAYHLNSKMKQQCTTKSSSRPRLNAAYFHSVLCGASADDRRCAIKVILKNRIIGYH